MAGTTTNIDFALEKLIHKQKLFTYQIAKLEYKIYVGLIKLEKVNLLINTTETNIISLNAAILAAGEGEVAKKLLAWKTKEEYRLFKYNLRKNKIDVTKLVINQSKLKQCKKALEVVEKTILTLSNHVIEKAPAEITKNSVKPIEATISNISLSPTPGFIKPKSIVKNHYKLAS